MLDPCLNPELSRYFDLDQGSGNAANAPQNHGNMVGKITEMLVLGKLDVYNALEFVACELN